MEYFKVHIEGCDIGDFSPYYPFSWADKVEFNLSNHNPPYKILEQRHNHNLVEDIRVYHNPSDNNFLSLHQDHLKFDLQLGFESAKLRAGEYVLIIGILPEYVGYNRLNRVPEYADHTNNDHYIPVTVTFTIDAEDEEPITFIKARYKRLAHLPININNGPVKVDWRGIRTQSSVSFVDKHDVYKSIYILPNHSSELLNATHSYCFVSYPWNVDFDSGLKYAHVNARFDYSVGHDISTAAGNHFIVGMIDSESEDRSLDAPVLEFTSNKRDLRSNLNPDNESDSIIYYGIQNEYFSEYEVAGYSTGHLETAVGSFIRDGYRWTHTNHNIIMEFYNSTGIKIEDPEQVNRNARYISIYDELSKDIYTISEIKPGHNVFDMFRDGCTIFSTTNYLGYKLASDTITVNPNHDRSKKRRWIILFNTSYEWMKHNRKPITPPATTRDTWYAVYTWKEPEVDPNYEQVDFSLNQSFSNFANTYSYFPNFPLLNTADAIYDINGFKIGATIEPQLLYYRGGHSGYNPQPGYDGLVTAQSNTSLEQVCRGFDIVYRIEDIDDNNNSRDGTFSAQNRNFLSAIDIGQNKNLYLGIKYNLSGEKLYQFISYLNGGGGMFVTNSVDRDMWPDGYSDDERDWSINGNISGNYSLINITEFQLQYSETQDHSITQSTVDSFRNLIGDNNFDQLFVQDSNGDWSAKYLTYNTKIDLSGIDATENLELIKSILSSNYTFNVENISDNQDLIRLLKTDYEDDAE